VVRPAEATPPEDPDESALVARLRAADETAFREVWDQYHARLADFAFRYLRSRDAAADVVQDVFVALWERHAHIEIRGTLAGYLYGMVRHTTLDVHKHERVVRRHEALTAATYQDAPTVARNLGADRVDVEAVQRTVRRVIGSLPPRTREIFLMSREDGLAPGAIAVVLGIAPQVVYNQLSRALAALHQGLEEDK
jgi:RNA polymerase sigma-70 factor (ECF subfamily)